MWIDPSFYEQLYSIIYHSLLKRNAVNSCYINWFSCSKLFFSVVTKITMSSGGGGGGGAVNVLYEMCIFP